ncbi:MAG: hypothetical protein WD069_21540 [Planctomycetales bacterium]
MPGQLLRFLQCDPLAAEFRHELPPERMEVEHPAGFVRERQSRGLQVGSQHFRSPLAPRSRPQLVGAAPLPDPPAKIASQFRMQRQHIATAALGVRRLDRHRRRRAVEVETRRGEAVEFLRPQAGVGGRAVQKLAILSRQPPKFIGAPGRLQQLAELLRRQSPPTPPHVGVGIERPHVSQRAYAQPAVPHHPGAECLCRRQEVVGGLDSHRPRPFFLLLFLPGGRLAFRPDRLAPLFLLPLAFEPFEHGLLADVAGVANAAAGEEPRQPLAGLRYVLRAVPFLFEMPAKIFDVPLDRPVAMLLEAVGQVDFPPFRRAHFLDEHRLRRRFVGAERYAMHSIVRAGELPVPLLRLAADPLAGFRVDLREGRLEQAGHHRPPFSLSHAHSLRRRQPAAIQAMSSSRRQRFEPPMRRPRGKRPAESSRRTVRSDRRSNRATSGAVSSGDCSRRESGNESMRSAGMRAPNEKTTDAAGAPVVCCLAVILP